ncbi:Bug family tripartite tricarboxylate transporter substrate binding protein [Paracidovorax valerianellae]|uniref:Tripartite-type tricarboxylate transporter, receptor component TctC n=1 Tax=Paracidovorax valerianellae TaxID=187868 RepID=A0A1G6MBR1_9BURK|nr:Bug family tripartite tricarboxylate transporter substrate binding protein [Paracidovorax valerianellae]MDA8444058.1 Bug family tripartite tricarboxylate transporter substrate binding protein [Paracidovorax valerianellae]SDC52949.1 Tripartite-type tricarboxylate transporter, receptor component TctC [Paracidovorax valerianellae]
MHRSSSRRHWVLQVARAAVLAGATGVAALASAQAPASGQPIRVLVGFPPGGGTDAIARLLAEKLKDELGTTVVVDNRPGAGGQIAAQALKAAPADGHTVFLSHDHTISILPQVVKHPGYDPVTDFIPVGGVATFVNAFAVSGALPAKSFNDYVHWIATQGGGKGAVGIPAPASTPEFLVKLIGEKYRIDLVAAPYRGSAPMIADMLGNQIPAGVGSVQDFIENHKGGKVRVVAVLGTQRQAALADVPTFDELGLKGFEDLPYYGFYAPAGTPAAFVTRFSQALAKVVAQPEVNRQLTAMGLTVAPMSPQQLGARQQAYTQAWTRIIQRSGFVPQ